MILTFLQKRDTRLRLKGFISALEGGDFSGEMPTVETGGGAQDNVAVQQAMGEVEATGTRHRGR